MPQPDRDLHAIARAIEDNTREIKKLGQILERYLKPTITINNPVLPPE